MAIRKIARLGHPVLRQIAREVKSDEIQSPQMRELLRDMVDSLHEYGGIGLAAPQIHEAVQVAVIEFTEDNKRYPGMGDQALTVFINPRLTVLDSKEQSYWEGCLSIPEMRGLVFRPRKIQIDYLNPEGQPQQLIAEGFLATVFQHEFDHLNGILYVDHLRPVDGRVPLTFVDEYKRYVLPQKGPEELEE